MKERHFSLSWFVPKFFQARKKAVDNLSFLESETFGDNHTQFRLRLYPYGTEQTAGDVGVLLSTITGTFGCPVHFEVFLTDSYGSLIGDSRVVQKLPKMLPNSTWGFPQYIRVTMEAGLLQMVGRCRNKLNITAKVTVFGRSQSAHNLTEVMSTMAHYSNPESESSTRPSDDHRTPASLSPITTPSQPVCVFDTPPPSGSPPAPRRIQRPSTRSVQDNIERAVAEFKHQMEDPEASIHILPGVPAATDTDHKPRAGSFLNQPRSPNDTVDQILAEIQRYTRGTYSSLREDFAHAASKDCFDTFLQVADPNGVVVQVESIRSLLCLRSPVFRQSLGEHMAKGVTVTNVDVNTVVSLVEFCHTDSCDPLKADFSADPVATIAAVLRLYQFAVVTQTETLRERLDLKILEGLILSTTVVKEAMERLLAKCAGISQIEVPLRSLLLKVSRAA